MAEVSSHAPGRFCWVDLATGDAEEAKRFYGALFGWEFDDRPAGDGMVYSMALLGGKDVAALYRMSDDERAAGGPRWQTYVAVASADDAADRALALGATLLMPPFDVPDAGRMTVIQDPAGAVFAAWQPRGHKGSQRMGEPGTFCWAELLTPDEEKAGTFYSRMFGWEKRAMEGGPVPYTIFMLEEKDEAGMMKLPAECADAPPSWLVYFMVADCAESVAKAEALGARAVKGVTEIPGIGSFAVLLDPQGAAFAIFRPREFCPAT